MLCRWMKTLRDINYLVSLLKKAADVFGRSVAEEEMCISREGEEVRERGERKD